MALLEWGGKRVPVAAGELILGSDPASAVPLSGPGILPKHAILRGLPDGQVFIRKATPEAEVVINGVRLGAEPTPLLHGDKVEVGGHELSFVDERRSGSTQYIQAMPAGGPAGGDSARAARPTGNTGGRVVSLTDGREYAVAGTSLVFGREATCDVVVPGKDVSRKHAEILSGPEGYVVVDHSTNGTLVNGERVQGRRLLARADVIAIGEETFRFYADAAAVPPAPSLQDTSLGVPAAPPPIPPPPPGSRSSGGALASFLVRTGSLKGQRLTVRTPVVNIGRADYNDFVITDESISTAHAKLQRREGVWILVDLESTNGSFIDGERVAGEAPLSPGSTVRLGEVSLVFEPTDDAVGVQKGGGTRLLEVMKPPAPPAPSAPPAPAAPPPAARPAPAAKPPAPKKEPVRKPATPPAPQKKKGKGCGASVVVFALGAGAFFYWLLI